MVCLQFGLHLLYSTCISISFSSAKIDFQGGCDQYAIDNPILQVQIRTRPRSWYSTITQLAILFKDTGEGEAKSILSNLANTCGHARSCVHHLQSFVSRLVTALSRTLSRTPTLRATHSMIAGVPPTRYHWEETKMVSNLISESTSGIMASHSQRTVRHTLQ